MKSPWPLIIVILYFIALMIIVRRYGKLKEKNVTEFAVMGRSAPWYLIIFTVLATWVIGSTYTATFGFGVTDGTVALYMAVYSIMALIIFYFIGPRVWVWGKVHDLYNVPDYIKLRYRDKKLAIIVAIAAGVVIAAPWQIMALKTFGYVTDALTYGALPQPIGMAIFAVLIAIYCIYGGMRSVVLTDFFQGIISVVVVIIGIIAVFQVKFGGLGQMFQDVYRQSPELLVVEDTKFWTSIIIPSALAVYCFVEIFNRIFLAKNVRHLKIIVRGAPLLVGTIYVLVALLGIGGSLLPSVNADLASAESGFFTMFNDVGGPLMLAFAAIVVIAAEMSSVDSQIATGAIVVARNIIGELKKEEISDEKIIKISRIVIAIWMVVVYCLSILDLPALIVFAYVSYEFLLTLFPTVILGIMWKKGTTKACWASIAVGWALTGALSIWTPLQGYFGGWGPGITGGFFAFLVYIIISLSSKEKEWVVSLFDEVNAYKE